MTRRILAILAHPDDESYGLGGTLARYAAEGIDVHVAVATDGAAGSIDDNWKGDRSRLVEAREKELDAASDILGVTVHRLGYRDSGYVGDQANENPAAFINADFNEAVARVRRLIEELEPDVLITHDDTGGYFHPDHIRCYEITTNAFESIREAHQASPSDETIVRPARLYYSAFPNRWVRTAILLMRLRGVDPSRAGRNQDVDFTRVGRPPEMITTYINYGKYWDIKRLASAQHGSQGGGTSFTQRIPTWIQKRIFATETYIRAYPPVPAGFKETDLFSAPFP
jgi:LmbE family N-acetylglucosaminyl deacetylase